MLKKCLIPVIMTLICVSTSCAKVVRGYTSSTDGVPGLLVDSIDSRKDLTRVYGRLIGTPHTSSRIDRSTMQINGSTLNATDIDGVDFGRYFQWEDDGVIMVEIDFPAVKNLSGNGTINFVTPRGEVVTRWKQTKSKPAKKGRNK